MAVVAAFQVLNPHAGLTCYFRAAGCTSMTISDCLPLLSKITTYADEYIIGEMKIFDSGSQSVEPNNNCMVRVIIYNDGWICAWFDKESQNQGATSSCPYVDAQTLSGFGTFCEYPDKWNGCYLEITGSTDPDCPVGAIFSIRDTDEALGRIIVHKDCSTNGYHFNVGYNYNVEVYMSNGNLAWWSVAAGSAGTPPNLANRLYRAIYEMWENLRYSSDTTNVTDTSISKAYLEDAGSFTDYTALFNSSTINDVPLIPAIEEVDDAFYYGMTNKFSGMNLNIGTAGVGNTIVWEYWNGSAWTSLSVTDNTTGFTVAGTNTVTFAPPDSWAKTTIETFERYWIRSRVSVASFTTQPLLTQGWAHVQDELAYTDTNLGMYSFEDTSALYCLICGKTAASETCYFYNTCLLGKTIYCHVLNWSTDSTYASVDVNDTSVSSITTAIQLRGYSNINIESIDGNPGIQNVFKLLAGTPKTKAAVVLITS